MVVAVPGLVSRNLDAVVGFHDTLHVSADRLVLERSGETIAIDRDQLVSLHLGRLKDAGNFTPQQVSLAKRNNVDIATNIARETRRLLGANGILLEYPAIRHMLNLESVYTYEGTHDIHTLVVGQDVTGLAAFDG